MNQQRKETRNNKIKCVSSKQIEKRTSRQFKDVKKPPEQFGFQNCSIAKLKQQLEEQRRLLQRNEQQMRFADKMYHIECFKNRNYKDSVLQAEKYCQDARIKFTKRLIDLYKDNKESPLFNNENGLSPFDIMLLELTKNKSEAEVICMICYSDIEVNSAIVTLPCSHILHSQCGVQHLLFSRACPGCSKDIDLNQLRQSKPIKMNK